MVGTLRDVARVQLFKKLGKDDVDAVEMVTHADEPRYLVDVEWNGAFVKVVPIEQPPIGNVLYDRQVSRMALIVANVEQIVVHKFFLANPLKENMGRWEVHFSAR